MTGYGARIEQLVVPDAAGRLLDVVLGYDSLEAAIGGSASMGAFIGRYAGRIGNAAFTLDGVAHRLAANDGPHCLHGGLRGTRMRVFDAVQTGRSSVEMRYRFADGEEGFPGTLELRVTYTVTEANELSVDYEATALDRPTVASFTTHAFFNLNGEDGASAMDHELEIHADNRLELDAETVATGSELPVEGTPFDFRRPARIASRLGAAAANGAALTGFDDCYRLRPGNGEGLALAASLYAPLTNRLMQVWSTEPALQFYTGMDPARPLRGGPGKSGRQYFEQQAVCLEPQGFPNAPNCPGFPSALYQPGQRRVGRTVYRFGSGPAPA